LPGAPGALVAFAAQDSAIDEKTFTATYERAGSSTGRHQVPTLAGFTLTSDEIAEGGTIPVEQMFDGFDCGGGNFSPSLHWTGAPAETQSFVLTMYDSDAPTPSGFWHWLVFNIPAAQTDIIAGDGIEGGLPGAGIQGYNDTGQSAYAGPCPPVGDAAHHYTFTLYAMPAADLTPGLSPGSTGGLVGFMVNGAALAKATLSGTFAR
jgi:Raf kinase inhibitor-like YbhB/YbcL family protein